MKFNYKKLSTQIIDKVYGGRDPNTSRPQYTIREAAKECGLKAATFWRAMEMKNESAEINTILKICSWLGKPITDFIK